MLKYLIILYAKFFKKQICKGCKAINNTVDKYCKNCGRIIQMPTDYKKFKEWEERKNVCK